MKRGILTYDEAVEMLEESITPTYITRPNGEIVWSNRAFRELLEFTEEERKALDLTLDSLIRDVDRALYQAKQEGKNKVCVYTEGN